ncbi:MAG: hypothetical protein EP321_04560 [Sphingomonadales bacterium]|nr:MAG: hypothetical protein EP345_05585 [Sphingomonadales bacterium]TNF05307.1 MAG: hypothetical protein EP321_04560 [Sphingomonadales bacterium]
MAWLDYYGNAPGFGNRRGGGGGVTPPSVPFTSVNADGWNVDYAETPPAFNPLETFTVARAGYDATGAAVTHNDMLTLTQRVRLPYPDQASLTALTVALSDYILATDSVSGASNASTATSPKPIANWAMLHRQLVGDMLVLEVTGNHWFARDGKPFACVEFSATDGTATITAKATQLEVSSHVGDQCAVLVYKVVLDISTLADGLITANAKVYPWVGGAASVADSSASTEGRGFSPRYFYKDAVRFATPPLAYVASTGDDGAGVVSTDAATASASPFLTVSGAMAGLIAASGVTGERVDGCRIRVMDTVSLGGGSASAIAQQCAAMVVERDPNTAKANAIVQQSGTWRPRIGVGTLLGGLTEGAVLFRDLTFTRSGTYQIQGESANKLNVMFADGLVYDNASISYFTMQNANAMMWTDGAEFINATQASVLAAGPTEIRMLRGLKVDRGNTSLDGFLMLGCAITRLSSIGPGSSGRGEGGTIIQFNKFENPLKTTSVIGPGSSADVTNYSFSQNLVEECDPAAGPGLRASADSTVGNLTHVLLDNVTVTGYGTAGRFNAFYDEGDTRRTHHFVRTRNSILANLYTKSDVFRGVNQSGADASLAIGNWQFMYGVGAHRNFTQFVQPGVNEEGDVEAQAFAGLGTVLGDSITVRNDPLFADYQGATASIGTGGGDYTLTGASPCIGMVPASGETFPRDLAGDLRDRGSCGAYR